MLGQAKSVTHLLERAGIRDSVRLLLSVGYLLGVFIYLMQNPNVLGFVFLVIATVVLARNFISWGGKINVSADSALYLVFSGIAQYWGLLVFLGGLFSLNLLSIGVGIFVLLAGYFLLGYATARELAKRGVTY